jgi:ATP synthase protein I
LRCDSSAPRKIDGYRDAMPQNGPDHDDLRALGSRLDEVQRRDDARKVQPPPTSLGIAFRFSTELFVALLVGAAIGWGLDRLFKTAPTLMLVFGIFGVAAGIRNVIRASKEINAQIAAAQKRDEEK